MFRFRYIARTVILSMALAALPLSGCARTLSVPVSASQPDRELTDCHAIQTELRGLEPLVRDPFEHNEKPLFVLAVIVGIAAVVGGFGWADAKIKDPSFPSDTSAGQRERSDIEDDEQFWKGLTYSSLAVLAASLGLNSVLSGVSERDKAKQAAMQKRLAALRRMRLENDCVNYGAQ